MNVYIIYKLISEAFLSFYPTLIKNLNIPSPWALFARLFTYTIVSTALIDFDFIRKNLFTTNGILIGLITLVHVAASFRSFQILDGGVAITLGYLYPFFILLMSGEQFHYSTIFFLLALALFVYEAEENSKKAQKEEFEQKQLQDAKSEPKVLKEKKDIEDKKKENFKYEGFVMVFLNVITEAFIYFLVKKLPTKNSWNIIFLSYLPALVVVLTMFIAKPDLLKYSYFEPKETFENNRKNNFLSHPFKVFAISFLVNALIGATGYYLRFTSINHIKTTLYAYLSFFGIITAYIYGYFLSGEPITMYRIIGTILIIFGNILYINSKKN